MRRLTLKAACWMWLHDQGKHEAAAAVGQTMDVTALAPLIADRFNLATSGKP